MQYVRVGNATDKGSIDVALTPLTYSLTGLQPNTTYNVSVLAVNAAGGSAIGSTSSALALAASPPCPVNNVVITPGSQAIALSWASPNCFGGLPLTGYFVSLQNNLTGAITLTGTSLSTTYTFTGLTNGQYYVVRIAAANTAGNSTAAPSPLTLAKPSTIPQAPVLASAASANQALSLQLSPPTNDGGLAVSSYTCVYNLSSINPTAYENLGVVFRCDSTLCADWADKWCELFRCMQMRKYQRCERVFSNRLRNASKRA